VRNCASQVITYCGQMKLTRFWSKILLQTMSKALLKSIKMHLTKELDPRSLVTLPKMNTGTVDDVRVLPRSLK